MSEKNMSSSQFKGFLGNRVLDFNATKMVKARTGVTKAIPADDGEPLSESSEKYIQDMLNLNAPPKKSMLERFGRAIGVWE